MDTWNSLLPDELLVDIFSIFLDVRTLVEVKLVCRQWQHLSTTAIDSKGVGTTRKVFETHHELQELVKRYCPVPKGEINLNTTQQYCDRETAEDIACTYGWPIHKWNVSQIEDFSNVFNSETSIYNNETNNWELVDGIEFFNEDISEWNVSNARNMNRMFLNLYKFNQDLSTWNVCNVTNMESMFHSAYEFNQDLSSWDVSNVTNMMQMFSWAKKFNGNLSTWDVSNVTNMAYMFCNALQFNQNISTWNVSNVTNMESMFNNAEQFNQDLSSWNVSNVTTMEDMFREAYQFNQDISTWDISNVTNMNEMFYKAKQFNQNLSNWDISNVTSTSIELMFSTTRQFNRVFPSTSNKNCIIM